MVGSAAIKQGRSANRKHTYFFGLIEYKIIYRECEGGTRGSPIDITRLAE